MVDKAAEILDRLNPKHLQEEMPKSAKELKQEIETETTSKNEVKDDPKMQKTYAFSIDWKDSQEKRWEGNFINKILSIRERQLVGIMRARLANTIPAESLDSLTQELNLMVAHLTFSLTEKPTWAEDLLELEHIALLQTIYMEVMAHEAMFFGRELFVSEG